jgi:hypothetical protein
MLPVAESEGKKSAVAETLSSDAVRTDNSALRTAALFSRAFSRARARV